jgi:hypothetical protein
MQMGSVAGSAAAIEHRIKEMVKQDLGEDLDFNKHPQFDNNHHFMDVPAGTPARLEEVYNRYYDQYSTSKITIGQLPDRYRNAWGKYEAVLNNWK